METIAAIGWMLAAAFATRVFWPSLTEYGKQKGKNLADKEDIAVLTRLVEDVKQENLLILEQVKGRNQLRVAAAERRLQAHQEAFTHWRELIKALHHDSLTDVVAKCQDWWEGNCVYLSPAARLAFNDAYSAALAHRTYREWPRDDVTARELSLAMERIRAAADAILEGAQLPSLGEAESRDVTQPTSGEAVSLSASR